jgi:hypothetical protein
VQRPTEARIPRLGQLLRLAVAVGHVGVLDALAHEQVLEVRFLLDVLLAAVDLHGVQRRHGDVDETALDQRRHLPVEEGQDQRADVRAVDVGVGHDDHAVVAQLLEVELVADACPDRGDHRLDLRVREHLVDPVLLGVDHLAAQRQDRLEGAVARVHGRAAGGVALDEEQLGRGRIGDLAVGQLAGQRGALECALAPRQLPRLARRLPGA